MAHVNEARELADLGMIYSESFSTRTNGGQIFKWPTVAKVDVVMEIGFYTEGKPCSATGIVVSVLEPPFSRDWAIARC